MDRWDVLVDLPEACEPLSNFLARKNSTEPLAFDILVKREFSARQQADRYVRLPDGSEAAGDGIVKPGRYQLVLNLGRRVATWCRL